MQTLRCGRCGSVLPSTASYCPKCGAPAASRTTIDWDGTTLDESYPPRNNLLESPALDQGRFVPGQILAERYRIVALLGKGGMGEVYRADDLRLSQPVAMKFLPEELSRDGAALARFHREVRLARQISHSNVCRVFDVGESGGLPFLTMEYVDGEDLASLLRRIGRLPQDKAIDIARQLCAGLAAAHEDCRRRHSCRNSLLYGARAACRRCDNHAERHLFARSGVVRNLYRKASVRGRDPGRVDPATREHDSDESEPVGRRPEPAGRASNPALPGS